MTILIFFIVLAILVITHELGHFLVAKMNGVKVEEFGFGFPPRIWGWKKGETLYSINWIPFGGFVKILGEEAGVEVLDPKDKDRSLSSKPRYIQTLVLLAGVTFNFLLAWLILSAGLWVGLPTSREGVPAGYQLSSSQLIIVDVSKNSPAAGAGLKAGEVIASVSDGVNKITDPTIAQIKDFFGTRAGVPVALVYRSELVGGGKVATSSVVTVIPRAGIVEGKAGIGVSLDEVGILKMSFFPAIYEGLKLSLLVAWAIITTLWTLLIGALHGQTGALSSVTGPVGLVGVIGTSLSLGISYLLNLVAIISLNLAVINLLPFPALDGGRIFFIAIEAVRRKAISPKFVNAVNSAGFLVLLALLAVLTYRDILHLFDH